MYLIRSLSLDRLRLWDAYVRRHPQGTIFHTTQWLNAISDDVQVLVAENDGEIHGGISLATTRKNGLVSYHRPPYTPYGGPLFGIDDDGYRCRWSSYTRFIQELFDAIGKVSQIDFILPPCSHDIIPYKWSGFDITVNVTNEVRGEPDAYIRTISSSKRRDLTKFTHMLDSSDITVTWGASVERIVELWRITSKRAGFSAKKDKLYSVFENLGPDAIRTMIVSNREHGDLAGCLCAHDEHRYYNIVNASRRVDDKVLSRVNTYALYRIITECLEQGKVFDFEGSSIAGVAAFYREMGGEQVLTYRLQKTRSPYYAALRFAKALKTARAN